jgi:hypothetical protein
LIIADVSGPEWNGNADTSERFIRHPALLQNAQASHRLPHTQSGTDAARSGVK